MHASLDESKLLACRRCPRLVEALATYRRAHPDSYALPVPARGPRDARVLIVGLAPGRRGANHTGLVFAGDASGRFLFQALARTGFSTSSDPLTARLKDLRMTNALKCWPPGNQPRAQEFDRCRRWFAPEIAEFWRPAMRKPRVIVTLGRLAHEQLRRLLGDADANAGHAIAEFPAFSHGGQARLQPTLTVISSYHPSLQNVNTKRLTPPMLQEVFLAARRALAVG
ncbi:MAG: uracil-DNA glycosylase family protein [Pseudomonadota bacterium]